MNNIGTKTTISKGNLVYSPTSAYIIGKILERRILMAHIHKEFVESKMRESGIKSQSELAGRLGMDYRYLNKLLNGKAFTSTTLQRLADQLGVRPGEIVA